MKALIIVDVQNDFCEGGALGVEGGRAAAGKIAEFVKNHRDSFDYLVTTQDWHDADNDNGGHFAENPNFVDTWPRHCVSGTEGAALDSRIATFPVSLRILKGMGKPAYSGFEGLSTDRSRTLADFLDAKNVQDVIVVGIAYDYCVKKTAIDAINHSYNVTVMKDLTASVDPANDGKVTEELEKLGVKVI